MNSIKIDIGGCSSIDENLEVQAHVWVGNTDSIVAEQEHLHTILFSFADGFLVGFEKQISPTDKTMLLEMASKLMLVAQDFQQYVSDMPTTKKKGKKWQK